MINPILHKEFYFNSYGRPLARKIIRGGDPMDTQPSYLTYGFNYARARIDGRDGFFSFRIFWNQL